VNVIVARSPQMDEMLRTAMAQGRLDLTEVDAEFVHQTQAAGFRQRREGLSWRLSRRRGRAGVQPKKRAPARAPPLPPRRRAVYALRAQITAWSHRMFLLARVLRAPGLYLAWARVALATYQGVVYSRGGIGVLVDRLEAVGRGSAVRKLDQSS
jgi:hypothetical protein